MPVLHQHGNCTTSSGKGKTETASALRSWHQSEFLLYLLFLFAFLLGCGSDDAQSITVVDTRVTVIGLDGEKRLIASHELYDHKTGQPAVKSVLVIDRQSNRQVFIDLDQLSAESPAAARYILMTDG